MTASVSSDLKAPEASTAALRRALQGIREIRKKHDALLDVQGEAIAVVGMACRFPGGADNPDEYWRLIQQGQSVFREVPVERWSVDEFFHPDPETPGCAYSRHGAFLDGAVDQFDPTFFGISSREAVAMDPQQRLLLETAWQALENAAISPHSLEGSDTGVYAGLSTSDYTFLGLHSHGPFQLDPYGGTGTAGCVAAGRLSYTLGLRGPCMPIDTACSSSLVAMHLAIQALRRGECSLALAGGVNLMLFPSTTIYLCKLRALSPAGCCRPFDERADGYIRGEGCGVVVLKRLSDAQRAGDPIVGLLTGSAVNHDGRSGGLTVPNGAAQEAVIRAALRDAKVAPSDLDYIEGHGTGTALGDPIEVRALRSVFGPKKPSEPDLCLASVKAHIGHLEAAAGVAGVIKVLLSLQRSRLPGHLVNKINPLIDLDGSRLCITTAERPWPSGKRLRRAGVSSFGLSGTNAHLVIEQAPRCDEAFSPSNSRSTHMVPLSVADSRALPELARRHLEQADANSTLSVADRAFSLTVGRAHLAERAAVVVSGQKSFRDSLQALVDGREHKGVFRGQARPGRPLRLGLYFLAQCNMDERWFDDLGKAHPVLAEGIGLARQLFPAPGPDELLFCAYYAASRLWRHWGVQPRVIGGRGVGEHVAACVAGALDISLAAKCLSGSRTKLSNSKISLLPATAALNDDTLPQAFLEQGCEAVLVFGGRLDRSPIPTFSTLVSNSEPASELAQCAAQLYVAGASLDWKALGGPHPGRRVVLPNTPFVRQRCWMKEPSRVADESKGPVQVVSWTERKPFEVSTEIRSLRIVSTAKELGSALEKELHDRGHRMGGQATTGQEQDVVFLATEGTDPVGLCRRALELLNQSVTLKRISIVTRGAQATVADPTGAVLWGFFRSLRWEQSQLQCNLIDLDPHPEPGEVHRLADVLLAPHIPEVALRGSGFRSPSLKSASLTSGPFSTEGSFLVVGGLGGIGRHISRWLVAQGVRHLVLASRGAATEGAREFVQELTQLGAEVNLVSADCSSTADVKEILRQIDAGGVPLRGVFHAAGVLDDDLVESQTVERFSAVFRAKIDVARSLHTVTLDRSLNYFVLCSSLAGVLGSPGQVSYAAANAWLDALAAHRVALGLPGLSVQWGPWEATGMAARISDQARLRWRKLGVRDLSPSEALGHLERVLRGSEATAIIAQADWTQFVNQVPKSISVPVLALEKVANAQNPESNIRAELSEASLERRNVLGLEYVREQVAQVLGVRSQAVPVDRSLLDLGLDSLMAMDLLARFRRDLQIRLYPREFYEHPDVGSLAPYLVAEWGGTVAKASASRGDSVALPLFLAPAKERLVPKQKLPGIVFVLSAPRSGSTLLRVMLAGHSELFSPPELHLLPFSSMRERHQRLAGTYLEEGLQRALMKLQGIGGEAASRALQRMVQEELPIYEVYRRLQQLAGNCILVDKSPTYAVDGRTLDAAEQIFKGAKYIHLVRHPRAVIASFVRMRMQKLIGLDGEVPHEVAERLWLRTNRNIASFLAGIDSERGLRVNYESLVRHPKEELHKICAFLGVPYQASLLAPYEGERMTDGVALGSVPVGDPNFLERTTIDARLADVEQYAPNTNLLAPESQTLMQSLGYEVSPSTVLLPAEEECVEVGGLSLCVSHWGPKTGRPVLLLHGILDHGASWARVAQRLVARGRRVLAPDFRGHGCSDHAPAASSYHLLDLASDVAGLIRRLNLHDYTLVGHSMGSVVALLLAVGGRSKIRELIMVETPQERKRSASAQAAALGSWLQAAGTQLEHEELLGVQDAARRVRAALPAVTEKEALRLARRITIEKRGGLYWAWDARLRGRGGLGLSGFAGPAESLFQMRTTLRLPVLTIRGRNSDFMGDASQPDWRILEGGHNLHTDSPDALAGAIADFTSSNWVGE